MEAPSTPALADDWISQPLWSLSCSCADPAPAVTDRAREIVAVRHATPQIRITEFASSTLVEINLPDVHSVLEQHNRRPRNLEPLGTKLLLQRADILQVHRSNDHIRTPVPIEVGRIGQIPFVARRNGERVRRKSIFPLVAEKHYTPLRMLPEICKIARRDDIEIAISVEVSHLGARGSVDRKKVA